MIKYNNIPYPVKTHKGVNFAPHDLWEAISFNGQPKGPKEAEIDDMIGFYFVRKQFDILHPEQMFTEFLRHGQSR